MLLFHDPGTLEYFTNKKIIKFTRKSKLKEKKIIYFFFKKEKLTKINKMEKRNKMVDFREILFSGSFSNNLVNRNFSSGLIVLLSGITNLKIG